MILVDSSSWIHFFNQTDLTAHDLISELIRLDQVATCGPVIMEVMSGCQKDAEAKSLREHLNLIPFLVLDKNDFYEAAAIRARLRSKGIRVKTVDTLIAYLSLREKIPLLHHDADYNRIARHLPLKICKGSLGT